MIDKVNMSLDEIIRTTKRAGAGGPGGTRGGRRTNNINVNNNSNGIVRRTGRVNGVGVGVGVASLARRFKPERQFGGRPTNRSVPKGNLNDSWKHDLFTDSTYDRFRSRDNNNSSTIETSTLLISNLDFGVSDSDIVELFSEIGPLKKAAIHYDRSGRSLGTAEVIYERQFDAAKAQRQYHGVPLDGRPMNIQSVTSEMLNPVPSHRYANGYGNGNGNGNDDGDDVFEPVAPRRLTSAGGSGRQRGGNNQQNNFGGNNRFRKTNATQPKRDVLTAEELDAELDSYAMDMN